MNSSSLARISSMLFSLWILRSIGFDKSKLKIPMMDFASITYLPDTKSNSASYFVTSLTKAFTLSIEFKEILTPYFVLRDFPLFTYYISMINEVCQYKK